MKIMIQKHISPKLSNLLSVYENLVCKFQSAVTPNNFFNNCRVFHYTSTHLGLEKYLLLKKGSFLNQDVF